MASQEIEVLDESIMRHHVQEKSVDNDTLANMNTPQMAKSLRTAIPQVLAVSAKNLLLLSYGMTLGFPTVVIPALITGGGDILTLTMDQLSWFASINLICVPLGCLLSGTLAAKLGRKLAMILINLPIITAWFLYHYASSVGMLYTSLVLTGLSGGLLEAACLTYVAEVTQPHMRGFLSAVSSISVVLGVFIQLLMGPFLNWRTIATINVVFPVAALISLVFVPESPYWLVGKGRLADAERSLCWLRGWRQPSEVHVEFNELVSSLSVSSKTPRSSATWRNYTHHTFLKPFLVVSISFFISFFSGSLSLQVYAVPIFKQLRSPIDAYFATCYFGIAQILGSVILIVLVHWIGKRPLAFVSTVGTGICLVIVATYAYCIDDYSSDINIDKYNWVPVTFLLLVAFLSNVIIKHLPWMLIGEVYPDRVRNLAAGASGSVGYIFGFIVNKLFVYMVDGITLAGTFMFYGAISLLGAVYLYYYLPETEDRTLKEIEDHFDGKTSLVKSGKCGRMCSGTQELYTPRPQWGVDLNHFGGLAPR